MDERTCKWCGGKAIEACKPCLAAWKARPDAEIMTPQERVDELRDILEVRAHSMEVPLRDFMARINALMGRPIYLREMRDPAALLNELASGEMLTIGEVCAKLGLPADTTIVAA